MSKAHNVKLTDKAHALLSKKAEDSGFSMKEIASEAIIGTFKRERDKGRYAFGTFILGAITSGALMFMMGVLL